MIEHSSTPENLHSLLYGMESSVDDALEWAYIFHLEKLMLESESYARLCIRLLDEREIRDGLKDAIWRDEDAQSEMGLGCHPGQLIIREDQNKPSSWLFLR